MVGTFDLIKLFNYFLISWPLVVELAKKLLKITSKKRACRHRRQVC